MAIFFLNESTSAISAGRLNQARGSFNNHRRLQVKPTLGLDFPNLPYLIDDSTGVKIIQSQAILRYLARQYGANTPLYSGTAAELAEMDQFMDQLIDYRTALVRWSYGGSTNDSFWQHSLPPHLEAFSHYLSKHGKSFAVSESVTIADFIFYEVRPRAAYYVNCL